MLKNSKTVLVLLMCALGMAVASIPGALIGAGIALYLCEH